MSDLRGDSKLGDGSGGAAVAEPELLRVDGTVRVEPTGIEMQGNAAFEIEIRDLTLGVGECLALLGRSGSGKTSLLSALFSDPARDASTEAAPGAEPHARFVAGERVFAGRPWPAAGTAALRSRLRDDLCILPQDPRDAFDPLRKLRDSLGLYVGHARVADAGRALHELGIPEGPALLGRYPHQVSGGQLRAVLLAVALVRRPRLVVADEPSSGLDPERVLDLARVLNQMREIGTAVIVSTHDAEFAAALHARCLTLPEAGRTRSLAEGTTEREVAWPTRNEGHTEANRQVVLEAVNVGVRLRRRWVLEDASLAVHAGESIALVGPSGAGKSTFAKVLSEMIEPTRGRCRFPTVSGRGIRGRGGVPMTQLLFQAARASMTPSRTVGQLVAEGARLACVGERSSFDIAAEARELGLDIALLSRRPHELSGGEARRAALLRALAARPAVLILDEPTAELDRESAVDVVRTVFAVRRRARLATVWITHDHSLAGAVADRVVPVHEGRTR